MRPRADAQYRDADRGDQRRAQRLEVAERTEIERCQAAWLEANLVGDRGDREPSAQRTQEGVTAVLGSIAIGVPVGLGLGVLSVRILGLFFTLPPPLLTVPLGKLAGFVLLMAVTSAAALGAALLTVSRVNAAATLREP